ncbi:MAG: S8 family serine peptidase [Bacteroidetes bacterium]|nr:S8 family serine peptidase [Bacteroidota bacterium]
MKLNPISLTVIYMLFAFSVNAQNDNRYQLSLKSGSFTPAKNITSIEIDSFNQTAKKGLGKSLVILQFEEIPNTTTIENLKQQGIELLDYIPNFAYTATISGSLNATTLTQAKTRAVFELQPEMKMQPELTKGIYPSWAVKGDNKLNVWISFPKTFSYQEVAQQLASRNFEIVSTDYNKYQIISLQITTTRLNELASLPFIDYVQAAPPAPQALNTNSMAASRANTLKASLANGGRALDGEGVVVGVGDNGDMQTHLDFTGRLINRVGAPPAAHATHVAGTVGGAGLIYELYAGYAPKATILGQVFTNIITYAPAYVQDYDMVIGNHSYGSVTGDCYYNGLYDLTARILDQQAIDLPKLQHVFAAGNDGNMTCAPYPAGFKTVLGGFQSAKNIITVGATDYKRDLASFSSRGPVRDGRIKPEIMSMGQFEASTWTNNLYSYNNGTSMAAPGVSGGLALLIQRYRQLNSNANPKNGLMKALLCNGASDRGKNGPDFSYGFGSMNLLRSVTMMENNTYFDNSITQSATNTQTINVPANTAQLKVMLYWNDPAASVLANKTLVNDLDLSVTGPGGTVLPFTLDTLPVNVANAASTGLDKMNNIEQVVINNPALGNYDLKVNGTTIALGPSQEYFLVYDIIPQSLTLTNPVGGEMLIPNTSTLDTFYIQWDSYTDEINSFKLEFSTDDFATSTILDNNISASSRLYPWAVPNIPTDFAKIRLTKNNTAYTQTSNAFVITQLPTVALASVQCEGYISITWNAIPGATDYEVMWLRGKEMQSVTTTTATNYTFSGLSKDSVYWVAVRARINGHPGRRSIAISRQPNDGTCAGAISDNDLKLDAIISPSSSGRINTSTSLSNNVPITIRIKNLDDAVSSGDIAVSYTINGGSPITETITAPTANIGAGATLDYTFATNADLSALGTYNIEVTATKATDPVVPNNSLIKVFKQLDNQPITNVQLPWKDDLESSAEQTITQKQMGIDGSDRYDFVNSTAKGRMRTFINSGMAYSGSKALNLDVSLYNLSGNTDSLTGTFNLSSFNTATDDIRLDFRYKNHGQLSNAANKLWIRGNDLANWISVYDLFANQNPVDSNYKLSSSIQLADSLMAHTQNFSSSFQARWGQWGQYMTADNESGAGYTFDDIRIYKAVDDIQMISIDAPTALACGYTATVPVKVTVNNTSSAVKTNIPVVLLVDGATIATETIASINAKSIIQYTFTATADLSAPGYHTIETRVNYPTDNVRDNDTARVKINNLPMISSFPYLEDFETNNGYWYSDGKNNSWEYGTPNSPKIKRAASGTKIWKTNLDGYYNDDEKSYLYSPCFNLSTMTNPTLSLSIALDLEACVGSPCDAAWVEYSNDGGTTWNKLGSYGSGTNWYNQNYGGNQLWSVENYTRWHVATTALPTINNSNIRLRFVMSADAGLSKDGIAIDDIHIYDNIHGIYDVTGTSPIINQTANGNGWIDFIESGTNKLIASINPNGQNMGSTDVQSYINTGAVRINSDQYYHDRNITIKPATIHLSDSATVRLYFLDTETEALINATGCGYCFKPSMAYELGVTKYSDPSDVTRENGTLSDNIPGNYLFINNAKIKFVPFDKGYYAEYKVKNFSEFWLNNGGFDKNTPLPAQLISFTATKQENKDVLTKWITASETNVHHYEIEVAKGNNDYQNNRFNTLATISSRGNSTTQQEYSYVDIEASKTGVRYYRLKIIDNNGNTSYSAVRPIVFNNDIKWNVYPNPSSGTFWITYQAAADEAVTLKVYDVNGRKIQEYNTKATGFEQSTSLYIPTVGMYLLELSVGNEKQRFKLMRQ